MIDAIIIGITSLPRFFLVFAWFNIVGGMAGLVETTVEKGFWQARGGDGVVEGILILAILRTRERR